MKVTQEDRDIASRLMEYNHRGVLAFGGDQNDIIQEISRYRITAFEAGARAMQEEAISHIIWGGTEIITEMRKNIRAIDLQDLQYD